jgi:predicted N-acyltransferase
MRTVEVLTTIGEVAPDEWDALCADRTFVKHRWLRLAETVLADYRPRYVLVRRDGALVSAAIGALSHRLQNPTLDARFGWLVRTSPFLQIGVPMTASPGLLAPDRAEVEDLLQAVLDLTRRERFRFCIVDHLPLDDPTFTAGTTPPGYTQLAWLPDTSLDLAWTSFDDYLAALPRKKRQEIRRTRRRTEREGIVVKPLHPTPDTSPTLDRLVADLIRKYGGTRRFGPDLFGKAASLLGPDLALLGAHRHGRLVGCVAMVRCDDIWDVRWIGRDYEHTADTSIYHAMLTACVQHAIDTRATRLHFGAAAYDSKKQLGVRLEPRTRLFAARSRAVTWLMGRLAHRFEPPGLPRRGDTS